MLTARLPHLPWDSFYSLRQGDPLPHVRVRTDSSRLFHTKLVENAVLQALEEKRIEKLQCARARRGGDDCERTLARRAGQRQCVSNAFQL